MKTTQNTSVGNVNPTTKQESSSEELIKKTEVEGTPFTIIKHKNEYNVLLGRYRIAGPFTEMEQAEEASKDTSWNTLLNVIQAVVDANKRLDNDLEKINKLIN